MSKLSFTGTEDLSTRNSVAISSTYFVDVKYYTRFKLMGVVPIFTKDQKKDETIKVIYNDNSNSEVYIPKVDVSYNSANDHYVLTGKVVDGNNNPVSVITEIKYFDVFTQENSCFTLFPASSSTHVIMVVPSVLVSLFFK